MATIPLLQFPCLVQQNIFKILAYRDLFHLSFCSEKSKAAIRKYRWKDVVGYWIDFDKGEIDVLLQFPDRTFKHVMTFVERSDLNSISGLPILREESDSLEFLVRIQRHTCGLFSKTPNLNFNFSIDDYSDYQKVECVRKTRFFRNPVKVEHLEEFMRNHPKLKLLMLDKQIDGGIHPTSIIYDIESIWIIEPTLTFNDFLVNFRGRNAVFSAPVGFEVHIDNLIENWLNGKFSNSVRMIYISQNENLFPTTGFLDKFNVKQCNSDEWPESYDYDKEMQDQFSIDPSAFDCVGAVYITREHDGKKATIHLETFRFVFCVWD